MKNILIGFVLGILATCLLINITFPNAIQKHTNYDLLEHKKDSIIHNYIALKDSIILKDSLIINITNTLDSINNIIIKQDTVIKKIYIDKYEDLNNVSNMDTDERILFFTNYFNQRKSIQR